MEISYYIEQTDGPIRIESTAVADWLEQDEAPVFVRDQL